MRLLLTAAALLLLGLGGPRGTRASRYKEDIVVRENSRYGPVMEGPMYSIDDFVGVVKVTPYLGFEGTATLNLPEKNAVAQLNLLYTYSPTRLPIFDDPFVESGRVVLCDDAGDVSDQAMEAFGKLVNVRSYDLRGGTTVAISSRSDVRQTGYQHIIFFLCRPKRGTVGGLEVRLKGEIVFENPYGYLPASDYGFLPFLGILTSLYVMFFLWYSYLALVHRTTMLRMQVAILVVITMSLVECCSWFLTYVVMNDTGGAACCPWRTDLIFSIVMTNFRRVFSAVLVLSVALGWGIVHPRLSFRTNAMLGLTGLFYLGFLLKFDLIRMERSAQISDSGDDDSESSLQAGMMWALPIAVLDVFFIMGIYLAMDSTMRRLADERQEEKLAMYRRLGNTLRFWVLLWMVYAVFDVLVRSGRIPLPWRLTFLLYSFWDVLYFGILVVLGWIWRPSETSTRYAYSAQLPTDAVLDEFETDFEMTTPSRHASAAAAAASGVGMGSSTSSGVLGGAGGKLAKKKAKQQMMKHGEMSESLRKGEGEEDDDDDDDEENEEKGAKASNGNGKSSSSANKSSKVGLI